MKNAPNHFPKPETFSKNQILFVLQNENRSKEFSNFGFLERKYFEQASSFTLFPNEKVFSIVSQNENILKESNFYDSAKQEYSQRFFKNSLCKFDRPWEDG